MLSFDESQKRSNEQNRHVLIEDTVQKYLS